MVAVGLGFLSWKNKNFIWTKAEVASNYIFTKVDAVLTKVDAASEICKHILEESHVKLSFWMERFREQFVFLTLPFITPFLAK